LSHRIVIQQLTTAGNGIGGVVETWTEFATVWAAKEDLKGREFFEAQKYTSNLQAKFRIRYRPGITPVMRVLFGTRNFRINGVIDPDGRSRELLLMCEEVV
jgi:SPP1 family predicted phage head-tail adaptor